MHRRTFSVFFFAVSSSIALAVSPIQERADRFLALANAGFQSLYRVNRETQWSAVTDVTRSMTLRRKPREKLTPPSTETPLLSRKREISSPTRKINAITIRQLKQLLLNAAEGPMTNPDLVDQTCRSRNETGLDPEQFRIQTERPKNHR